MSFIKTFSGKHFYYDKINKDDIDINDIAVSLSNICRIACFEVDHMIIICVRSMRSTCVILKSHDIAQNIILVVGDFVGR